MAVQTYTRSKTGDIVYRAVYFGPDGRRVNEEVRALPKHATKDDHRKARTAAQKLSDDQRCAVENGTWIDPREDRPAALSFDTLVSTFLKQYQSRTGGMGYWEQRAKTWLRYFGGKPAALKVADADAFRQERGEEVGATTVRQDLSGLSTLYRWGKVRRLVRENPFDPDLVRRPRKARPDPHPLSDTERVALLSRLKKHALRLAPVVELALETGADRGELLALNWNLHIDRERKLITLPRAKTDVARVLPYGQNRAIKRVLNAAGKVRDTTGAVFLDAEGKPLRAEAAKQAMRDAWGAVFPCSCPDRKKPHRPRASCPTRKPKPWKSLRATFATRKVVEGWDVPTVAALMGLTSAHVLEHYAKPAGKHLEAAMADVRSARARARKAAVHPSSSITGGSSRPAAGNA